MFQQDSIRSHTSLMTRSRLRELGLKIILHSPYRPDIAPIDYYLLPYVASGLGSVKLASKEACEEFPSDVLAKKEEGLYKGGIMKFLSASKQIIEQNSNIFELNPIPVPLFIKH